MPRYSITDEVMGLRIPSFKTRLMMKSSPDVDCVSSDSVVCLSKATEMFVSELVSSAVRGSRSELTYKDLARLQCQLDRYNFLADVIPQKITGREWIEKYKAEFDESCL
ncbi:Chromatin accessibility complex protein [Schistosoma japonicum]|uniref:Chromatin accessibility complex protein n=1 Tax=Schistosoma japonicum TaxID=6182 RepID=C1L450_SCHJA|nr:Chromatin accessibility complex protein 1 [Schistosoma japonicum]KAH8870039.1 Chromatin accessibility complex protein 1 [Schistosoma japonicum]TNN06018.1 Chromatin accessibility complex protein [Schistosoma japonicum]TNN06019.1 Chromatin accessibility complex protein [Schistosoma japonicum]TNN06020.1 Chromatin accessibility complex protein [Schistosoma japonicum]